MGSYSQSEHAARVRGSKAGPSADPGLAFALDRLETLRDCFRLLEVFGRGTPERQASTGRKSRRPRRVSARLEQAPAHVSSPRLPW
jgi:hypothetical protein